MRLQSREQEGASALNEQIDQKGRPPNQNDVPEHRYHVYIIIDTRTRTIVKHRYLPPGHRYPVRIAGTGNWYHILHEEKIVYELLETAESQGGAEAPLMRQLRPKSDWLLKPEPGPTLYASVWTATQPSRRSMDARYMSSLELTLAALRGQAAAGALVRCDGVEGDLQELLPHWNYVSVHFTSAAQARPLWHAVTSTWRHPTWATFGDYESKAEALATAFLTFGAGSQSSLHRDAVSSAWLITAGERDLWVLPPWAAAEALPDVDTKSGKYGDTLSLYDPWRVGRQQQTRSLETSRAEAGRLGLYASRLVACSPSDRRLRDAELPHAAWVRVNSKAVNNVL